MNETLSKIMADQFADRVMRLMVGHKGDHSIVSIRRRDLETLLSNTFQSAVEATLKHMQEDAA